MYFKKMEFLTFWGIDGEYINKNDLLIPENKFITFDLKKEINLDKKFDLVVSLEVAEHLPEKCAQSFVKSLTNLGDFILFSAAIPSQGGTNHINEQWPEYWINIFNKFNFKVFDCVRHKIWNNQKVDWWYSQNCFLYVKKEILYKYKKTTNNPVFSKRFNIVHPRCYLKNSDY